MKRAGLALACAVGGLVLLVALGGHSGLSGGIREISVSTRNVAPTRSTGIAAAACRALPAAIRNESPRLAMEVHGALRLVSLARCTERTVVSAGAKPPVRASANGRWVAEGRGVVASVTRNVVQRPLGTHLWNDPARATWAWSPRGQTLAGITTAGGVLVGHPGDRPRTLLGPGWGATSLAFAGTNAIVVVRGLGQLWRVPLGGGSPQLVYHDPSPTAALELALVVHGTAVVWRQSVVSSSGAADGAPLERISLTNGVRRRLARMVVIAPDYVVSCGRGIAIVAGEGRDATNNKHVVIETQAWRATTLGRGVSPTCSANGHTIAYADGPTHPKSGFLHERRVIELVSSGDRPRAVGALPKSGSGAYLPILAADGQAVIWVQGLTRRDDSVVVRGTIEAAMTGRVPHRTGPIIAAGSTPDFYGTLAWAESVTAFPR
jgi:hypothetical protein